jgi:hypothetical protein
MDRWQSFLRHLATLDGRKPSEIGEIAKALRAASLISPRRGSSAVRIPDASALLLATLTGEAPTACPRAVSVCSSLVHHGTWGSGSGFPSVKHIQACDYFGEAIDMLLRRGLTLKQECLVALSVVYGADPKRLEEILAHDGVEIRLSLWKPVPRAVLQVRLHDGAGVLLDDIQIEWRSAEDPDPLSARAKKQTEVFFTGPAVFELAELLHSVEQEQPDLQRAA